MSFAVVSLVALVVGFFGSLPLAGPIAILVVSNAAGRRYTEARRIAMGAAAAEGGYAFLAFWGFATFLASHALVLPISHGLTAVFLCGLGLHFVVFTMKGVSRTPSTTRAGRFWLGFWIAAANPTLLVTWGAVTTFLFSKGLVRMTGLLAVPFGVAAAAGVGAWGLATVAVLKRVQVPRATLTRLVRAMGLAMIGLGLWSGVELARFLLHRGSRPSVASVVQPSPPAVPGLQFAHQEIPIGPTGPAPLVLRSVW